MENSNTYIVSVLMPAYNVEQYIGQAIESILNQTFRDFEFIIINDGSTDGTESVVSQYDDKRIRLINNDGNKGLIYTLNLGLSESNGKYIARMDSDDIAFPDRLQKQVDFMENNPDIFLLGGSHRVIGSDVEVHHPKYDEEIRIKLLKGSSFTHPTVMMRSQIVREKALQYDIQYPSAEDYNLWVDTALAGLKMANLEDVILNYRVHKSQITSSKAKEQGASSQQVRIKYFKTIFGNMLNDIELNILKDYAEIERQNIKTAFPILLKLFRENKTKCFFDVRLFNMYLCGIIGRNLETDRDTFLRDYIKVFFRKMPFKFRIFLLKYLLIK